MVDIIGTNRQVGVVPNEPTAKAITGVDRVRANHLGVARADIGHIIVQTGVVNVIA